MKKNNTEYLKVKLEILINELKELIEEVHPTNAPSITIEDEDQTRIEVIAGLVDDLSEIVDGELLCRNCDCEGCDIHGKKNIKNT